MADKASQYKLMSNRNAMTAVEKQCPNAVQKVALRELSNEIGNVMSRPGNSLPLNDKKPASDSVKLVSPGVKEAGPGTKRECPDGPLSLSKYHIPRKFGPNIVYVRRKLEVDHISTRNSATFNDAKSSEANVSCNCTKEDSEKGQNQEHGEGSCPAYLPATVASLATSPGASHSLGKSFPGLIAQRHDSVITTGTTLTNRDTNDDWKDRFVRLQLFLQSCDHSSQEDYIHKLRSLPATDRSRHAVNLEKRAIDLVLEEGKELHRMRLLNVLGKGSPRDQALTFPTHSTSPVQFQS